MQITSTPVSYPAEQAILVEQIRESTCDSRTYVNPTSHELHCIAGFLGDDASYDATFCLLDRRLNMNDVNYTTIQTTKAMYIIRQLLLIADMKFAKHYMSEAVKIRYLLTCNPRQREDSVELMQKLKDEAAGAIALLEHPEELEAQRRFFTIYQPVPTSPSGVDILVRSLTDETAPPDPRGDMDRVLRIITAVPVECTVVVRMIERRLNLGDENYSCLSAVKALQLLQHCLGCNEFVTYWIDNSRTLLHLRKAKCRHYAFCEPADKDKIVAAVKDILSRLDHHQRFAVNNGMIASPKMKLASRLADSCERAATPPPTHNAPTAADMRNAFPHISDLTTSIIRHQRDATAQGAFSDVFQEKLRGTNQLVAVKQLRHVRMNGASAEQKLLKRLNLELEVWSKLDHPYVNPLLGITFSHAQFPGFVSPWYKNGTLMEYLKDERNRRIDRLVLFHKIVQAVQSLHHLRPKIIHGDIKPANIMIQDNGDPALSDYGLSKITDKLNASASSSFGGTTHFVAPELLDGTSHRGEPTDIWALAGVCYNMFTGKEPYHELTPLQLPSEVKKGPPSRPSSTEGIPMNLQLWSVLLECWKNEPSERPSASALLNHLNGVPNGGRLLGASRPKGVSFA